MAPRRKSEIIDFREEEDVTRQSILTAIETQTEEVVTVSSNISEGNLANAKILVGLETEVFDQKIDDADVEE